MVGAASVWARRQGAGGGDDRGSARVRVHRFQQEATRSLGVCFCGPETLKDVQRVMATPPGALRWDGIARTKARKPSLALLLATERPHTWPAPKQVGTWDPPSHATQAW